MDKVSFPEVVGIVGKDRALRLKSVPKGDYLRVSLKSDIDLVSLATNGSVSVAENARYCDEQADLRRLTLSGIHSGGKSVFDWTREYLFQPHDFSSKTYDVLFFLELEENAFGSEWNPTLNHLGHSLESDAKDVCLSIKGGHKGGVRVRSNEIRIEYSEIEKAIGETK
ncbi:MAG: hypothetical protein AAFN44_01730 [Pseudomonadota bacterium]